MIFNLTMHQQDYPDVETKPRLRPVNDPADYDELKAVVAEAVEGLPAGTEVLVGGLGQFQALVMQLPFVFYFADVDQQTRKVRKLVRYQAWTRRELFDLGY